MNASDGSERDSGDLEGRRIGKYELRRSLGRGGMGEVFEAFDPDVQRRVAIKTIHPHLASGQDRSDYLERFRREAQATARCQHPNIVSILEYGETDEVVYLVMEFVDGVALDRLFKRGPVPLKRGLEIVIQMLRALDCAHREDIVHRDVKPSNVLVVEGARPQVKLTDFGIARDTARTGLTQVGAVVGTPDYMAPEQAFGLPVDARTDLFAVAIILHELLSRARYQSAVPQRALERVPGLPPAVRLDPSAAVPVAFHGLLRAALSTQPDERPASAREFGRALKQAVAALRDPAPEEPVTLDARADAPTLMSAPSITPPPDMATGFESPPASLSDPFGTISGLDEPTLTRVRENLADLLGPDAHRVVRDAMESAISFAEFVHGVANAIPNERRRRRFLEEWGL